VAAAEAPPAYQDVSTEAELLGAILLDNNSLDNIAGRISARDFYVVEHQELFAEMERRRALGKPITPTTVREIWQPGHKLANGVPIERYLAHVAAEATIPRIAPHHAETIRRLATMRALLHLSDNLRWAQERGQAPDEALPAFWTQVDRVRLESTGGDGKLMSIGEAAEGVMQHATDTAQGKTDVLGVPSGLVDLDLMIGGFTAGDLFIIAGRPGMAKSSLATSIALRIASRGSGDAVGLFSFEMPALQTTARIISDRLYGTNHDYIPYRAILVEKLDNRQLERVNLARRELSAFPLFIDFSSKLTLAQIAAKVRQMKGRAAAMGARLGVVFLDYLNMIDAGEKYRGQKVYEIAEITNGLKQLAKEEGVCIVLLAQVSRKVEEREDKRPNLSDLRSSGDIEQDADVVIFVYREAYYLAKRDGAGGQELSAEHAHDLEIIIGKNRNGPPGTKKLWVHMPTASVRNYAKEHEQVRREDILDMGMLR
jgi:replicative DNA helicase